MSSKQTELQKVNSKISSVQKQIRAISAAIVNFRKHKNKKALKAAKQALKKAKKSLSTLNKKKTTLKNVNKWKKRISKADKSGKYEIWITYNSNKKRMRFPVLPDKIQVSYPDENDKVYVYGVGDVTIKKHPGAFVLKWSGFFPAHKCQGCISNPKLPDEYVDFLKKVMSLETPAKIVFTGSPIGVNSPCTIKFDADEQGGDVGTVNYSITITEFEKVSTRKIKVKKSKGKKKGKIKKKSNRTNTKTKITKYTVKSGDCLFNIAKKVYGSGNKWRTIYEANKKVIGSNPNKLKIGMVLKIPNS